MRDSGRAVNSGYYLDVACTGRWHDRAESQAGKIDWSAIDDVQAVIDEWSRKIEIQQ